ncbi:MAG TPA: hypothetical protein DEO89_00890 [Lachnospiraceae bacterium]|nr:hypothetical protein [Lachnospiraceae bacterium]
MQNDSYVALVQKKLESVCEGVYAWNFGENGLKSKELLERLTDPSNSHYEEYNEALKEADLVTVSIGSNDLMQYLSQSPDVEKLKNEGDALFSKACEEFQVTLPRLVTEIEKRAPKAEIVMNNIYNPCDDVSFTMEEVFGINIKNIARQYIGRLNNSYEEIKTLQVFANSGKIKGTPRIQIADVNAAFAGSQQVCVNRMISLRGIDPHPNKTGHARIAEEVIGDLEKDGFFERIK